MKLKHGLVLFSLSWAAIGALAAERPKKMENLCVASYLLAPGPTMELMLEKRNLQECITLVVEKVGLVSELKGRITVTERAAKMPPPGMRFGISDQRPLAMALQHLCELYVCRWQLVGDTVVVDSLEDHPEFELHGYHANAALAEVLQLEEGAAFFAKGWQDVKAKWEAISEKLEPYDLRLHLFDDRSIYLNGEGHGHARLGLELALLLNKRQEADWKERVVRTEPKPDKKASFVPPVRIAPERP